MLYVAKTKTSTGEEIIMIMEMADLSELNNIVGSNAVTDLAVAESRALELATKHGIRIVRDYDYLK